eukprot:4750244-Pyramimonas_sp.AAC.1
MLRPQLKDAVLRQLERRIGDRHGFPDRVCFDIVARHLRSKKNTPLGKGTLRAVASGALWTRVRALGKGYQYPVECPLGCGCRDTLYHRIWKCPALAGVRLELVGREILDSIDGHITNRNLLFSVTRG